MVRVAASSVALALALTACGESGRYGSGPVGGGGGAGGGGGGTGGGPAGAPSVTIIQPATAGFPVGVGDSILVEFRAADASGVTQVDIEGFGLRGDVNLGSDTVVTRYIQRTVLLPNTPADTTMRRYLRAILTDSTSEDVLVVVTATDTSGLKGADTVLVRLTQGPRVTLLRPANGSFTSVGKSVTIEVFASDPQGVRVLGWRTTGVVARADSLFPPSTGSGTLPDTVTFIDTLTIPAGTVPGNLVISGFASDSIGDPAGATASVTVTVQSAASDVTPPLVTFSVTPRVEADDSISVNATDASGISRIGFLVRDLAVAGAPIIGGDSVSFSGNQTDVTIRVPLNLLSVTSFPRLVAVEAFAVDSVGNRGLSADGTTPVGTTGIAARDTLTVVAGRTIALPSGGQIGDAIFNRNRNELYLSNLSLNRLEVFQVGSSTFLAGGIPVGSRPQGLAMWPTDTLGTYGDTVVVANSGGTTLSIVDVAARIERRRHRLPNYLIQTIRTVLDPASGTLKVNILEFDLSDRPLYVGTVCRANCASVFAVYSTTPSAAQPNPFVNRGYVAWEQLNAPAGSPDGHFFWEHAQASAALANDTLQITSVRDSLPGTPIRRTELGGGVGIMASLASLAFQESTYVRSSGDFNHAVIGEGGSVEFARALTWDARSGTVALAGGGGCGAPLICTGIEDQGISDGLFVRDFVANRAARVTAVATNFNGLTNFVRADSIYVFDLTLRLTGLIQVSGVNPGMDVHPNNNFDARSCGSGPCGGTGSPNNRLMYAARADASIEVFDTYWFSSVATIPVRDPIIGPVRLALNAGGQQVLVAVTTGGVVVVPLVTPIVNPFPVRVNAVAGPARRR